jgi:hypothetical protein
MKLLTNEIPEHHACKECFSWIPEAPENQGCFSPQNWGAGGANADVILNL